MRPSLSELILQIDGCPDSLARRSSHLTRLNYQPVNHKVALIDSVVKRGMRVVDVGASSGHHTQRYLQLVGRSGRVTAIEPNPIHGQRLKTLAALHPNLTVHNLALSSQSGTATLHVPVHNGATIAGLAGLVPQTGETQDADVRTAGLDDLVEGRIDYVKIDVEGYEDHVIEGSTRILTAVPILQIEMEERHRAGAIPGTFDQIMALGYGSGWALSGSSLVPLAQFDLKRDQTAFVTGAFQDVMPEAYVNNFLFLPAGAPPPTLSPPLQGLR